MDYFRCVFKNGFDSKLLGEAKKKPSGTPPFRQLSRFDPRQVTYQAYLGHYDLRDTELDWIGLT